MESVNGGGIWVYYEVRGDDALMVSVFPGGQRLPCSLPLAIRGEFNSILAIRWRQTAEPCLIARYRYMPVNYLQPKLK